MPLPDFCRFLDETGSEGVFAFMLDMYNRGPIAEAAEALGTSHDEARRLVVGVFAHAAGLLLLAHTGRLRMFGTCAAPQMEAYVTQQVAHLQER